MDRARLSSQLLLCTVAFLFYVAKSETINATLAESLKKAADDSYAESLTQYNPNPLNLTEEFTLLVDSALIGYNSTRRGLKGDDKCKATNPIDRCWRCYRNWHLNRKKLADCARGFGHSVTGGQKGPFYIVTDPSDNDMDHPKIGTLRHAVLQTGPLWIVFQHSMVIKLNQELIFTNDKTIDGRGVQVHIAYGAGITIQFVHNIIIHNIWIHDTVPTAGGMIRDTMEHIGIRTRSDGDGINIFSSNRIWIDHVSLAKGQDGLIDVIEGSTAITISNCKFNHHNDVMLLGARDSCEKDKIMQVTVAFNRFGIGCIQRMPRVRWGFAHIVNNDYQQWEMYAIGGSAHPTIISQGNRFKASSTNPYTKEVTKRDYAQKSEWMKWQWRSDGDQFKNGAFFVQSGPPIHHSKLPIGKSQLQYKPGSYAGRLTRSAGALKYCRPGQFC